MRYIIAATAFTLVVGIALGFVVSRGFEGSASAAPPTQAVEEQNLDANAFIAVHEQGTANVNVVSFPSSAGRLIELGTLAASVSSPVFFPLADVSDCTSMRAMARASHARGLGIDTEVNTSPDGSIRIRSDAVSTGSGGAVIDGVSTVSRSIGGTHPFIQLRVNNGSVAGDITAWIWCAL